MDLLLNQLGKHKFSQIIQNIFLIFVTGSFLRIKPELVVRLGEKIRLCK